MSATICLNCRGLGGFWPSEPTLQAEFFGIDRRRLAAEKKQMLASRNTTEVSESTSSRR